MDTCFDDMRHFVDSIVDWVIRRTGGGEMQHLNTIGIAAMAMWVAQGAIANVPKDLAYPVGPPSADEIAKQVYFVNHYYSVRNFFVQREGKDHITVLAIRENGGEASTNTLRRFLNNDYQDGEVRAKDMALFHSGKLMGTGMLIIDYEDDAKSQSYHIWLPALKKIRHFSEPQHEDSWGGSDFTFGDIYLRKPKHENHELLGSEKFGDCLGAMKLSEKEKNNRYLKQLNGPQCDHRGKPVYQLKSSTKYENWWYDHRVSYVDKETYADYRTEYFKDGKKIKVIDRDWVSMGLTDPRGVYWRYWYGKNLTNGHETMISFPEEVISWNLDRAEDFWSDDVLKGLRR